MINKFRLKSVTNFIFFAFIYLVLIFDRAFSGIYLKGFRIGEYMVAIGLICLLTLSIFSFKYKSLNITNRVTLALALLILSFICLNLVRGDNFGTPYVYKASSYIWILGYLLLGYVFQKKFQSTKMAIISLNITLLISYFLGVIYYPEFLINFFTTYSDKFDFPKASMYLLFYVIVTHLNFEQFKKNPINYYYFLSLSGLFFPLFIFKSRGAFLAALIYFISYSLLSKKFIITNLKILPFALLAGIGAFYISSFLISGAKIEPEKSTVVVSEVFENKETSDAFISIYLEEGRLYSRDGNINWRLQIWQDVISNSIESNHVLFGYGYGDIIPAMDDPQRKGEDGTNENVHNFLLNIFARGGLFHLLIYIFIIYEIYKTSKTTSNQSSMLLLLLPIFIVSFFDASMENPHFPFLFYFFLGRLTNELKL